MDGRYAQFHWCGESSHGYPQPDCKHFLNVVPYLITFCKGRNVSIAAGFVYTFQIEPYIPYEFTCEGMLQRVNILIEKQVGRMLAEGWDGSNL